MKNSLKIAFLFVGTVIGAGFASGREIALFFGDCSSWITAAAGLVLGGLCALFLIGGKLNAEANGRFFDVLVLFSSVFTSAAMIAGAESLLYDMTTLPLLGLLSGVLAVVIVILGIEKIKLLNVLVVPLIIAFVLVVFFKTRSFSASGELSLLRPLGYGALNIFLAGSLISAEGKNADKKSIVLSSAFSGIFLALLLFSIQSVTRGDLSLMPMMTKASAVGLTVPAQLLILLAIFTTLVSSLKLTADSTYTLKSHLTAFYARTRSRSLKGWGQDRIESSQAEQSRLEQCKFVSGQAEQSRSKQGQSGQNIIENSQAEQGQSGQGQPKLSRLERGQAVQRQSEQGQSKQCRLFSKKGNSEQSQANALAVFQPTNKKTSASERLILPVLALVISYPLSFLGFDTVVDTFYPFISACGLISVITVAVKIAINRRRSVGNRKHGSIPRQFP